MSKDYNLGIGGTMGLLHVMAYALMFAVTAVMSFSYGLNLINDFHLKIIISIWIGIIITGGIRHKDVQALLLSGVLFVSVYGLSIGFYDSSEPTRLGEVLREMMMKLLPFCAYGCTTIAAVFTVSRYGQKTIKEEEKPCLNRRRYK